MAADSRRQTLRAMLAQATEPLAGGRLARELGVSRQVIVGDIAWLRATGMEIVSTARGYVMGSASKVAAGTTGAAQNAGATGEAPRYPRRTIKVHHSAEQTSDELFCILESGGRIVDVSVRHHIYGTMRAELNIATRTDALRFLNGIAEGASTPLLTITSGYHYHTIEANDPATLDRIERALDAKGYLVTQPRAQA